ncbi:unnamed protein product [Mytilus coruscus]|uniref:Integrase catalytic domain-containing protein n=1 Tax=Mytilus coruscus TaxID=42192 RepID=A0A6J8D9Y3_MYTCO|nr:unnamed protein product [Mytilus coruscus]
MHQLYNARTAGHLGREKTINRIKARYYWPGMSDDVARWVQSCLLVKNGNRVPDLENRLCNTTVYGPMECVAIDILGPLQTTENHNRFIMVVGDYFSKWTEAYALEDHTAQSVADKLVTEFICRFGAPLRIHTDQVPEFESRLFKSICNLLEINKSRTTPYQPQSEGMVERYNRTLVYMLSIFVGEKRMIGTIISRTFAWPTEPAYSRAQNALQTC